MFIDDLIYKLFLGSPMVRLNAFDRLVVQSLAMQLSAGKQITEKQGNLIIRLLNKYKVQLTQQLGQDISNFLETPTFKNSFRTVNNGKSMIIADHGIYNKIVKVNFTYNDEILSRIKLERQKNIQIQKFSFYDAGEKSWHFALKEQNLVLLAALAKEFNFSVDDELSQYLNTVQKIQQDIEKFIPMVIKENNFYKVVNLPSKNNLPSSTNLLELLFEARKYGVNVWDQTVEDELVLNSDTTTVKFLKTDPMAGFEVDLAEQPLQSISTVIKNLLPCVVIIPGGTEMEKLLTSIELFQGIGLQNSQMSVLFRLQNATNAEFNQFIREQKLNSPLTDQTRVVFLSQHIPKTILSPLKHFNSLLNFNYVNIHFKLSNLIETQENVINVLEKSKQRRLHFAIL